MKKSSLVLSGLILFLAITGVRGQVAGPAMKSISLSDIDRFISILMENNSISGLSANIVVGDEEVWSSSYGLSNRATNQKVSAETPFLLYSVTKSFTGLALMKVLSENNISLDEPINDYLPFEIKHPRYLSTKISFKMLLGHVSGIRDNWGIINQVYSFGEDTPIALGSFLEDYFSQSGKYYSANLNFGNKPGVSWEYSNLGASVAGYLVECISKKTLSEYCEEQILEPIGMDNSHFSLSDYDSDELAIHYDNQSGNYKPVQHMSSPVYPAGFLHSNNHDMSRWLRFLLNGGSLEGNEIISSEKMQQLHSPSYPDIEPRSGLFMANDPTFNVWGHAGGLRGVRTCYFVNYEEKWGVSVLSNGYGDPYEIFYFLMQAAREFQRFSLCGLEIDDDNFDGIIDTGEGADLQLTFRNNLQGRQGPIRVELVSENPDLDVISSSANLGSSTGNMEIEADKAFRIRYEGSGEQQEIELKAEFYLDDILASTTKFDLPVGLQKVLLIHDEHHARKNMAQSINRYIDIFNDLEIGFSFYDMSTRGKPSLRLLEKYQSIYWITGLDNSNNNLLPADELDLLKSYLDGGGNLFFCGQNINDQIGDTEFFANYLHATSLYDSWGGDDAIRGDDETEMGSGLSFKLTGGDSNNSQYSPGGILPDEEAVSFLKYSQSVTSCGIQYSGNYKLIYLSFGLEGIDVYDMAKLIIKRADLFFQESSEVNIIESMPGISIYPLPFENDLYLQNTKKEATGMKLTLADLSGKLISSIQLANQYLYNTVNIGPGLNVNKLAPGVYFLIIEMDGFLIRKKIVKL